MTLKEAIECVERKQRCYKEDVNNCITKECGNCEYLVDHEAFVMALIILGKLDNYQIGYTDYSDTTRKMWIDGVITYGEYYRIMNKLNLYWKG